MTADALPQPAIQRRIGTAVAILVAILVISLAAAENKAVVAGILVSSIRLVFGFVLSIAIGGTIGILVWRSELLDEILAPLLVGLQTLPSVCWTPLALLLFGRDERSVIFVLVMGSFSAIAIALRDGLHSMPSLYRRVGLMLGAGGWKMYRYVLLPASLPAFATTLRQGFSFAWRSLLGAELILTAVRYQGLGSLLAGARQAGGALQVIAMMSVMVLIGMLADRWVFARLQRAVNARFGLG